MQTGHAPTDGAQSISKPALLGLCTAIVVGVGLPLLQPHTLHPSMIIHSVIHLASLSIAVFLGVVSVMAYSKVGGMRMLFMMLGFISLAGVEVVYLADSTGLFVGGLQSISPVDIELPHVILLAMLCMFGLGVLKVNK